MKIRNLNNGFETWIDEAVWMRAEPVNAQTDMGECRQLQPEDLPADCGPDDLWIRPASLADAGFCPRCGADAAECDHAEASEPYRG